MSDTLNLVILGHVDHGKSTLIGRLLYDTGSLPEEKVREVEASAKKRGAAMEWAFLLDSLQIERDQGITVDTSRIWLRLPDNSPSSRAQLSPHPNPPPKGEGIKEICIIDAPGHHEFLRNMLTGAASADAALLLVDATEGLREQTRKHAYLLHLLGITQVVAVINKMDVLSFDRQIFNALSAEISDYLSKLNLSPMAVIPASAKDGDNVSTRSANTPWYEGATVLEALQSFAPEKITRDQPLLIAVQDVYRQEGKRIIVGQVESGRVSVGESLLFSPTGSQAVVAAFEHWPNTSTPDHYPAESAVAFTLSEPIFVERGHVASHVDTPPLLLSHIPARIFWLDAAPLSVGERVTIRLQTANYAAELVSIQHIIHTDTLTMEDAASVARNQVAEVVFRVRGLAAVSTIPALARFVIDGEKGARGAGWVELLKAHDQRVDKDASKSRNITPFEQPIGAEERRRVNGHKGAVIWFSGLSGAGKSTLAIELEKRLFARGMQVYVLDGDNIRKGLSRDLGFSPQDRSENIRRAAATAALMADAGLIVITAFITPMEDDRKIARAACPDRFHNIYIKADIATCERRDVKGLYKKARAGEIKNFTGISAPFEEPNLPDLVVDTTKPLDVCLDALTDYVKKQCV